MYEYDILEASSLIAKEQLKALSTQGWRLVTIVPADNKFYFYLERMKRSS